MKKHGNHGPIPRGNQTPFGPHGVERTDDAEESSATSANQDEKRRIGDYVGAGDAPYIQPGGSHDADRKAGMRRGSGNKTPRPKQR